MTLKTIHKVWREALMVHEIFRRLGFPSEEIFLLVARSADPSRALFPKGLKPGDLCVHVQLKSQGLEYTGCVGRIPCAEDQLETQWHEAVALFNGGCQKEGTAMWNASKARRRVTSVLAVLVAKGFKFQKPTDWN